jgi:hypothetical protein
MWRWALAFFSIFVGSVADAGQVRSSFHVGLTITGPTNRPVAAVQTRFSTGSVPLPRPRPAENAMLTGSAASASPP